MSSPTSKKGLGVYRKEEYSGPILSPRTGLDWMDGLHELDPDMMPPLRVLVKEPSAFDLPPYYRKLPVEQVDKLVGLVNEKVLTKKDISRYWPWNFNAKGFVRPGRVWHLTDKKHTHPKGIEAPTFESCGRPMYAFFDLPSKRRRFSERLEAIVREFSTGKVTPAKRTFSNMATESAKDPAAEAELDPHEVYDFIHSITGEHDECLLETRTLRAKLTVSEHELTEATRELETAKERVATLEDYIKDLEMITETRISLETCSGWKQVMGDALRE